MRTISLHTHDKTGNLTRDIKEGIDSIYWNVYGKIASIKKQDTLISYSYDVGGNRISKTVTKPGSSITTWYVRVATGNVMSVYTRGDNSQNAGALTQSETHLYACPLWWGSNRIGLFKPDNNVESPPIKSYILLPGVGSAYFQSFERGRKIYELSNHLGNVLATVSDRRIALDADQNGIVDYYVADVVSEQDYYPFGMMMQGRSFSSGRYRYGFNGKENDNEVKGIDNQQDYGMRFYDPRVGRFLSVDPLTKKYPMLSAYQYASNSPITATDFDGAEADWLSTKITLWAIKAKLKLTNAGTNFAQNVQTIATQGNQGHFRDLQTETLQEQVDNKKINTAIAKANALTATANTVKYVTIAVATPFVAASAAPVIPELFTISANLELSATGSYLVQKTISAILDVGAQKLIAAKVDWADIASNYLPVNGKLGKILLTSFQATVDLDFDKGLQVAGFNKDWNEAAIDAFASASVDKIFGRFNKQLEKAFDANGLKADKLTVAMGEILEGQKDFLESSLKAAISEVGKEKTSK